MNIEKYLNESKETPDYKEMIKLLSASVKKARTLKREMPPQEFKDILGMIANLESIVLLKYSK
jgi:hypothetical protein